MLKRYFNPYVFFVKRQSSLPTEFTSGLFNYKISDYCRQRMDTTNWITYNREFIKDPVNTLVHDMLNNDDNNTLSESQVLIQWFNDEYNIIYPCGLVPTHHMLKIRDTMIMNGLETKDWALCEKNKIFDTVHNIPDHSDHNKFYINRNKKIGDILEKCDNILVETRFEKSSEILFKSLMRECKNAGYPSLSVKDKKWAPQNLAIEHNANMPHLMKQFFDDSKKYYSFGSDGYHSLARSQGGLSIDIFCPVHEYVCKNHKECLSSNLKFDSLDGELRCFGNANYSDLYYSSFVPFWKKVYMLELLKHYFKYVESIPYKYSEIHHHNWPH